MVFRMSAATQSWTERTYACHVLVSLCSLKPSLCGHSLQEGVVSPPVTVVIGQVCVNG